MNAITGGIEARGVETIREEWRVTGEPGDGYPQYRFVFGNETRRAMGEDQDPEAQARNFIALTTAAVGWREGPHLSSRVIIETPWREESIDQ